LADLRYRRAADGLRAKRIPVRLKETHRNKNPEPHPDIIGMQRL